MVWPHRWLLALSSIILVVALAAIASGAPGPAGASHSIPVTVTITQVTVLADGLEGLGRGEADLYAGFAIGSSAMDDCGTFAGHGHGQKDIKPFWTCSKMVQIQNDSLPGFTNVDIQIWDHDECDDPFCSDTGVFESDDDQADVSPGSNYTLSFSLDLSTGRWQSAGGTEDVDWPQNCAQGTGDNAIRVCFDISIDSTTGDSDGDFLLDGWERNGFNADGDGTIDVDLPAMGANPARKDLFLELDCMADTVSMPATMQHSHCPGQAAMQAVVQSFANAPVANPDGTTGVQLHIDVGTLYGPGVTNVAGSGGVTGTLGNHGGGGDQIAEAGNTIVDWDGAAGNPATNFYTLKQANFNGNRALIFRYGLFVHQVNARAASNDCTSGWAEGVSVAGNDLIISLGGVRADGTPCWSTDANGNSVGSQNDQAGTLMHEFGHTLGLAHGGGDGVNDKPNYLSVMNYTFQACNVTSAGAALPGGCDFSRTDLADLAEMLPPGLDECQGVDAGVYGLGPINWDGSSTAAGPSFEGTTCPTPNAGNYSRNINGDYNDANGNDTQDPGEAETLSTLAGYDDWANLRYNFRQQSNFANGGVPPFPNEATPEMLQEARDAMAALVAPTLTLDATGPTTAIPGDTVTYGLDLENNGNGPALSTELVDTKPDGSTETFPLGTFIAGAETSRQVTYQIACTVADGTVLTNSAQATAVDMVGNAVEANDSASTTVQAPVLELDKTSTGAVAAGEAITYTLTYANTASGGATNVVLVDVLPEGVYYSTALDQGAGPLPTTAVLGVDGRWVLTWNLGDLAGMSGQQSIEFTARPSLLFTGGDELVNEATLTYTNANGCTYDPVEASAPASIIVLPPTGDPRGLGYWRNHPEDLTDEILARIQATDQRFDGADGTTPDGALSNAEVAAVLVPGGNMPKVPTEQLISVYANLATRKVNAGTGLDSRLTDQLGLHTVAEAAWYAMDTLALPVDKTTRPRYSDTTTVLDQINQGRTLVYD